MYTEDNLLPISALQHLLFCERQCALIHLEQLWTENRLTVEGRHLHENAHEGPDESRRGVRIARGLPLRSLRLGLVGVADVVEFHTVDDAGQPLESSMPVPIEYKRGRPKRGDEDRVQLCAQALCLEEMLDVSVPAGALFYGRTRRRLDVSLDAALRALTKQTAARLHALLSTGETPTGSKRPRCRNCSLVTLCMPDATGSGRSAAGYVRRAVHRSDLDMSGEDTVP